jgi:hypothetical protein
VGCVVVLDALDRRTRFIEQRPATGEVAVGKRVSGVLAGFDRLLVGVRTVLRIVRTVEVVGHGFGYSRMAVVV